MLLFGFGKQYNTLITVNYLGLKMYIYMQFRKVMRI